MAILSQQNCDTEPIGAILPGWSNTGSADFKVAATGAISGANAFGEAVYTPGHIAVYAAMPAQANHAAKITQRVNLDSNDAGANVGLVLCSDAAADSAYLALPSWGAGGALVTFKKHAGAFPVLQSVPHGLALSDGDAVHLVAEKIGSTIRAKCWKAGTPEPSAWLTSVTDTTFATGKIGIWTGENAGGSGGTSYCDDIIIADSASDFAAASPYTLLDTTSSNGQNIRLLVPDGYDEATGAPVVMYFHGAGESETALLSDALKADCVAALINAGYILAGTNAHGNNWGNAQSINDHCDLYGYLQEHYNITGTVFWSQSMGGMAGLNTLASGRIPCRGWAGIYPVTNLAAMAAGSLGASVRAAYGITGVTPNTYAERTAGFDPNLKSAAAFRQVPMRFWASYGDTLVTQAQNTDLLRAKVAQSALELGLVQCTGDHGDISHFQPADLVAFFNRALSYEFGFAGESAPTLVVENGVYYALAGRRGPKGEPGDPGADGNGIDAEQIRGIAVAPTAPADGQALIYDAASEQYQPGAVEATGGAGNTTLVIDVASAASPLQLSAEQSRANTLFFSGARTQPLVVQPPAKNSWMVCNGTGQNIRFLGASSGSGKRAVAVLAGEVRHVFAGDLIAYISAAYTLGALLTQEEQEEFEDSEDGGFGHGGIVEP